MIKDTGSFRVANRSSKQHRRRDHRNGQKSAAVICRRTVCRSHQRFRFDGSVAGWNTEPPSLRHARLWRLNDVNIMSHLPRRRQSALTNDHLRSSSVNAEKCAFPTQLLLEIAPWCLLFSAQRFTSKRFDHQRLASKAGWRGVVIYIVLYLLFQLIS